MVIILILFSFQSWAKSPELLKCLGAEEKRLHLEKNTGPIYDLNQRLIAEMVQIPDAIIDANAFKKICSPDGSESLKLLQLTITQGKSLFKIPSNVVGMQRQIAQGMIDDYVETSKEILLNLITQIQVLSPTPHCLEEEIPLLKNFFYEIKHLQEEVDIAQIFRGRDTKIFDELKNYPKYFQRCLARLKKKPKSGSTSVPK